MRWDNLAYFLFLSLSTLHGPWHLTGTINWVTGKRDGMAYIAVTFPDQLPKLYTGCDIYTMHVCMSEEKY